MTVPAVLDSAGRRRSPAPLPASRKRGRLGLLWRGTAYTDIDDARAAADASRRNGLTADEGATPDLVELARRFFDARNRLDLG
jgi:hypothetical protein